MAQPSYRVQVRQSSDPWRTVRAFARESDAVDDARLLFSQRHVIKGFTQSDGQPLTIPANPRVRVTHRGDIVINLDANSRGTGGETWAG